MVIWNIHKEDRNLEWLLTTQSRHFWLFYLYWLRFSSQIDSLSDMRNINKMIVT